MRSRSAYIYGVVQKVARFSAHLWMGIFQKLERTFRRNPFNSVSSGSIDMAIRFELVQHFGATLYMTVLNGLSIDIVASMVDWSQRSLHRPSRRVERVMPNSHLQPDTTRRSCLRRVWCTGVNLTIALNVFRLQIFCRRQS